MTKRKWLFGVAALALIGIVLLVRGLSGPATARRALARRRPAWCRSRSPRPSAKRCRCASNRWATVTPIASVAIKPRVDTEITAVHFRDGAEVKQGDLLFTLDGRAIEAQIAQAEGMIARDKAQLDGAERDVARYTDLVAKSATPVVNLDNAKTQADVYRGAIKSDQGLLENLKVQLSYCTITRADHRPHQHGRRQGRQFRARRPTPRRWRPSTRWRRSMSASRCRRSSLPEIRQALAAETATIEAVVPGEPEARQRPGDDDRETVDPATGMATIRATMPNEDEVLWPGTLVTTELTLRDRGGGGGAVDRGAGQPDRQLRVRGQGRRRQGAAGQGRAHGRQRYRR